MISRFPSIPSPASAKLDTGAATDGRSWRKVWTCAATSTLIPSWSRRPWFAWRTSSRRLCSSGALEVSAVIEPASVWAA